MLEYILVGGGFAFAAVVQPGPLQAYYLSRVAAVGWKRTLPAAFAPVISDGPIAAVVLLVLNQVPGGFERVLRGAGGLVLLYFAWSAFREWRRRRSGPDRDIEADAASAAPRSLWQAVAVNAVNPSPYLGWSLILGPVAIHAWDRAPVYAVALVASFYVTFVIGLAAFIALLGTTRYLGPGARRGLILVSVVALVALAVYQLASALA